MFCKNCGKEIDDKAAICVHCGTTVVKTGTVASQPVVNSGFQGYRQPVSVGGWIGRSLIPLIPFVGSIVYLVMLFIWAGDKTKEESFNNWAKAQLWVALIGIILAILVIIIVVIIAGASASMMSGPSYYYY